MAEYMRLTAETLPMYGGLLPDELKRRLASEKNVFAVGAVEDGTACAVLAAELSLQDILVDILYLVVAEEYRGRGIGSGLVEFFCRCAEGQGIPVRCLFSASGMEDPLYGFFVDLPDFFISEEDGFVCRIPFRDLTGSQTLMSAEDRIKDPIPFFSLPLQEQRAFRHRLEDSGNFYLEDLKERSGIYDHELCLCIKNGSAIEAAIFFLQEQGDLVLDYIWCAPKKQVALCSLLAQAARRISSRAEDGWLYIAAVEPQIGETVTRLFPQREIIRRYYCAAYEMV